MTTLVDLAVGTFAVVALALPGWLLTKGRGLPLPALAGFIIGLLGLVLVMQLVQTMGGRLTLPVLGTTWAALTVLTFCFRERSKPAQPAQTERWADWTLLLAVAPALLVVAYRAFAQPLSGVDTIFRWNYLAELMLARGNLDFYPPVSAADFSLYSWADGIAPAVASLYFWSYLPAGEARAVLTAPAVVAQFLLVLAAAWTLARRHAGPRAGAFACALIAASPLVLWGVAMGQDTGLLILALCGLVLYLPTTDAEPRTLPAIVAGASAALGGLAREYGLTYIALGAALILVRRLGRRELAWFLLTSLGCVLPWYLRNWARTGNPFFNLDAGGLFPVNTGHLALMDTYRQTFGWRHLPVEAPRLILTNMWVAIAACSAGILAGWRVIRPWLAPVLLIVGLWAVSIGYTAAGFVYAMRVLAPAIVLVAVLGAIALTRLLPEGRDRWAGPVLLTLLAGEAALRALVLPANVYRVPTTEWLTAGGAVHAYHAQPLFRELARQTAGHRLLVLGPNALLNRHGAATVPLWSPEVAFLWDESLTVEQAAAQLIQKDIAYVLLGRGAINQQYLQQLPFFQKKISRVLKRAWMDEDLILFRIVLPH